jgi:hypothetical protein
MALKNLFVICFFVVVCFATNAQSTVRGFVKDKETGEPVLFILVALEGTKYGSNTDENGYFSLTKIPAGEYTLFIKSLEYNEYREAILVDGSDKVYSRNIQLDKRSIEIEEIEISGDKSDQKNRVNVSVESISPQDIKRIPNIGGQPDLVQALTTLPGFVSTGDQGGQIFIRGGSPVQNKVYLDGMIVYNPFHSIGIYSVFDTDIIANADVYTGGFGSQYGGRISSIMDITTRDGNKRNLTGKVGFSPVGVRALLEGPLKKLNEKGAGISYVLSAKRSYFDRTSKALYPYMNNGEGIPFAFQDIYGKVSFLGSNGSKMNLFGFSFSDDVTNFQSVADFSWNNTGFGGNFVVVPSSSPVLISGNFARSNYDITLSEPSLPSRTSGITSFNMGLDFKYIMGKDALNYGVEVVGFSNYYRTFSILDALNRVEIEQNNNELGGFFTYRINRSKFVVEPGIRFQYYTAFGGSFSPEPRLGFKYKPTERLRIKLATGLYSQNLMAINSDRDVVNLFYGFLAGPDDLQDQFTLPGNRGVRDVNSQLQKAIHYVLGFEYDLTEKLNLNVEGYYRDFTQLINQNRSKVFPDTQEYADLPETLRKDFIVESGWAGGVDMVLKYETKSTYLYLVYSLARVRRWDGSMWYAPVFDRRHNVNFVASQKFGKKKAYEASLRWNLGSGLPFTQTQGYYQQSGTDGGGINTDYISNNPSSLSIQFAELNGGRLPYYHRLDINVKRSFQFSKKVNLEVNAGASNAYNRANVFYIDRVTNARVDQLPILPTIGLDLTF